jgi:hypothetical protein
MSRFIYRHSALIISCLLVAGLIFLTFVCGYRDWGVIIPGVAAVLSLSYFLQKQWVDEAQLCKELFNSYNQRYDELNNRLVAVRQAADHDNELTTENRQVLYDYFNICGEEYFWFTEGHIYRRIWRTWLRGMQENYAVPVIKTLWVEELAKGSYYGLNSKVLEAS